MKIVKHSLFQQRDLSFFIKGIKSNPVIPSHLSNPINIEWIRIPFPIPHAWSSPILSYSTYSTTKRIFINRACLQINIVDFWNWFKHRNFPDSQTSHYFETTLDRIDWQHLESLGPFYAILMDPPLVSLKLKDSIPKGFITLDDLHVSFYVFFKVLLIDFQACLPSP
jgi:hypothetical protein